MNKKSLAIEIALVVLLVGIASAFYFFNKKSDNLFLDLTSNNESEFIVSLSVKGKDVAGVQGVFEYNTSNYELVKYEGINGYNLSVGSNKKSFIIDNTKGTSSKIVIGKFIFKKLKTTNDKVEINNVKMSNSLGEVTKGSNCKINIGD